MKWTRTEPKHRFLTTCSFDVFSWIIFQYFFLNLTMKAIFFLHHRVEIFCLKHSPLRNPAIMWKCIIPFNTFWQHLVTFILFLSCNGIHCRWIPLDFKTANSPKSHIQINTLHRDAYGNCWYKHTQWSIPQPAAVLRVCGFEGNLV